MNRNGEIQWKTEPSACSSIAWLDSGLHCSSISYFLSFEIHFVLILFDLFSKNFFKIYTKFHTNVYRQIKSAILIDGQTLQNQNAWTHILVSQVLMVRYHLRDSWTWRMVKKIPSKTEPLNSKCMWLTGLLFHVPEHFYIIDLDLPNI